MRQTVTLLVLVIGGVIAWRIGETLSSDAISMGLGIFFGILAGIPAALLVMAASRRNEYVHEDRRMERNSMGQGSWGSQPQVIVVTPNALPVAPQAPGLGANGQYPAVVDNGFFSGARQPRAFNIVGGGADTGDEW